MHLLVSCFYGVLRKEIFLCFCVFYNCCILQLSLLGKVNMKCPYCGSDDLRWLEGHIGMETISVAECEGCFHIFLPEKTSDENERDLDVSKLKFGNIWD